jgi:catechol 2,3-dioxygenase-like lactoylglutathione lyase family enzyme
VLVRLDHVQIGMPPGREVEARTFYNGLLGLPEVAKPPELAKRGGCWFERGDLKLHLGVEIDHRAPTRAHPAFVVDDLDKLVAALNKAGYETPSDSPFFGHRRVHVRDPFGNRLELMQPE